MRNDASLDFDESSPVGGVFPIEQNPGVSHSGHERDHLFVNLGGGQFADVAPLSGLDDEADGRSFALLDFDRDGWQDIAVVNANNPLSRLYRNRIGERPGAGERGRIVALRFEGANRTGRAVPGQACRDGYGARARLSLADGRTILREHRCGEGMAAQNSATLLVGIGGSERVTKLEVVWPSGRRQEIADVAAGTLVTAYEDAARSPDGSGFARRPYGAPLPAPSRKIGPTVLAELRLKGATGSPALNLFTTMATWCPKCKGELPQLALLRAAFPEEQVAMHGVPVDPTDTAEKLGRYLGEYHPAYELLRDLSRGDVEAVKAVVTHTTGIPDALPATLVTDARGRVVLATTGVPSVSDLRKALERVQPSG